MKSKTAKKDSSVLAIIGTLDTKKKFVRNIVVKLYKENTIIKTSKITSEGDFWFVLDRDKHYTVEILAPGYDKKLVSIDTKLPSNVNPSPIFRFEFETELTEQVKGGDTYYVDFPLVLISYNGETDKFEYNRKYTENLKRELEKSRPKKEKSR